MKILLYLPAMCADTGDDRNCLCFRKGVLKISFKYLYSISAILQCIRVWSHGEQSVQCMRKRIGLSDQVT